MSDQSRTTATTHGSGGRGHESAQSPHQTMKFLTAATIGISLLLLLLSGLTLTGTVMVLILSTPVLLVFSPILVPAGVFLLLAATGLMFSGGCGVAAVTALTWIYNYVAGKNPPGADKVDYARMVINDKARDVTERAKEYGHYGQ